MLADLPLMRYLKQRLFSELAGLMAVQVPPAVLTGKDVLQNAF